MKDELHYFMTCPQTAKIENGDAISENTDNDISIYPNPAKDFVKLSAVGVQLSAVKVYNCLGMMIEEIKVNANEAEINILDYKAGVYFINIETENGIIVKQVSVKR
jgi:hypothetical protein